MSLNWEQAKLATNKIINYLDTIDLTLYLNEFKNKTIRELMDKLEKDYPYKDEYSETLFDIISESYFVKYLNKKYNLNIKETAITEYYIR